MKYGHAHGGLGSRSPLALQFVLLKMCVLGAAAKPPMYRLRRRYGAYRRTVETTAEAMAWEEAKQAVG